MYRLSLLIQHLFCHYHVNVKSNWVSIFARSTTLYVCLCLNENADSYCRRQCASVGMQPISFFSKWKRKSEPTAVETVCIFSDVSPELHCRQYTTHAQPVTHTHTYTYTSTAADNQLSCCATSTHSVYLPKLVCAWVSVCVCVLSDEWKFAASCRRSKKFFFVFPLFFLVLIFDIFSVAAKQQTNWQTAGRFHRCNWVNIEGNKSAMQMQGQNR